MIKNIRVETVAVKDSTAGVLVLPVTTSSTSQAVPAAVARTLDAALKRRGFTNTWAASVVLPAPKELAARSVVVVGLGAKESEDRQAEALRRGMGTAVQEARRYGIEQVAVNVVGKKHLAGAAVEAAHLATYAFTEHSDRLARQQKQDVLEHVSLHVAATDKKHAQAEVKVAETTMQGVSLARDLVNQPANHVAPKDLVTAAKKIAASSPAISAKIMTAAQAKKAGFTAFLSVAQGSDTDPYVIHLTYKPKKAQRSIALVGKGITFDTGGLSLKPAEHMMGMHSDMAGAAAVLGAFQSLTQLKPAVTVHGIIAACENMVSGAAYRPNDVITAKNGKTIEVLNTDAEGRITLADALTYATEQKPDVIIDLATLTGACVVALGENVAGLWGTDHSFMQQIQQAGVEAGERIETMPMPEEYAKQLDSSVADLRNIGTSRYGGAITAAMFLRNFVDDTPWAHMDIAGPAYNDAAQVGYIGRGGSGFGVRTLLNLVAAQQ